MGLVSPFQKVFDFKEGSVRSLGKEIVFRERAIRPFPASESRPTNVLPPPVLSAVSRTLHMSFFLGPSPAHTTFPMLLLPCCLIKLSQRATSVTLWITL